MEHNNRNYSNRHHQDYSSNQNHHRANDSRKMSKNYRNDERYQYSSDEGHTPYRGREGYESSSGSYGQRSSNTNTNTGGWPQSTHNRNRENDRNYDVNYSHNYDRDNYSSNRPADYRSSYDYMSYGQGMDDNNMNRYSYDSERNYGSNQPGGFGSAYGSSYGSGSGSSYQSPDYGSSYTSGSGRNYASANEAYGSGANFGSNYGSGSTFGSGTNYGSGSNYGTGSNYDSSYSSTAGSNYGDTRSSSTSSNRMSYSGKGPKGWQRSDENIRERVCDMLERDHSLDASEIEVTVKEGMVTLSGKVDQRSSKRRAEDIIENIPGVKDVKNEITVDKSLFQQAKEMFTGESSTSSDKSSNRMAKSIRH